MLPRERKNSKYVFGESKFRLACDLREKYFSSHLRGAKVGSVLLINIKCEEIFFDRFFEFQTSRLNFEENLKNYRKSSKTSIFSKFSHRSRVS